MVIVVNKVLTTLDTDAIKMKIEATYQCEVAAVVPHSDEIMELASEGIFALHFPHHPITEIFKQVITTLET